jgi:hypothetical protein
MRLARKRKPPPAHGPPEQQPGCGGNDHQRDQLLPIHETKITSKRGGATDELTEVGWRSFALGRTKLVLEVFPISHAQPYFALARRRVSGYDAPARLMPSRAPARGAPAGQTTLGTELNLKLKLKI